MPRLLKVRTYWARQAARRRAGLTRTWRVPTRRPEFVDYFPEIPGTKPEKIVFNNLVAKGVSFNFSVYFGDIPFTTDTTERYRPDFLLPDYRIIIDVQGVYWHSLPGKYQLDALRAAMLIAAGYKVYLLTDEEILANPYGCLEGIPELVNPTIRGGIRIIGDRPFDPSQPIRARIHRRPKIVNLRWKKQGIGLQVRTSWKPNRKPTLPTTLEGLFNTRDLDPEYLREIQEYGEQWQAYMAELEAFFQQYPEAAGYYPDLYNYWRRWRGWWDRFSTTPP